MLASDRSSSNGSQDGDNTSQCASINEKPVSKPAPSGDQDRGNRPVDPLLRKKLTLNLTILKGGILFHSNTTSGFVVVLAAILFHQLFEGLGLRSRIAAVSYAPRSLRPWLLVVAFGTTTPIGQAVGPGARQSLAGLLIYAATVDLLAEDFLSGEGRKMTKAQRMTAFRMVLAGGAAGMSVVGAFV